MMHISRSVQCCHCVSSIELHTHLLLQFHLSIFISDYTNESRCRSRQTIGSKGGMYNDIIPFHSLDYILTFCFNSVSQSLSQTKQRKADADHNKQWIEGRCVLCYHLDSSIELHTHLQLQFHLSIFISD